MFMPNFLKNFLLIPVLRLLCQIKKGFLIINKYQCGME